jgi:hypothetical protein
MASHSAHRGRFIPKNPQKYIASNIANITYRSSWENSMMMVLDMHPSCVSWASEAIKIPYVNPFARQRNTLYVPDFFVKYIDRNNIEHNDLIEVKPSQEVPGYLGKVSKLVEARQMLNMLKWNAARAFCAARNWKFRIVTEIEMFSFKKKSGL